MLQEVISKMDPTVGCLVLWHRFIVFVIGVCLNVKMYVYFFKHPSLTRFINVIRST